MVHADTDGEKILLVASYADNVRIKEVPGRRYDAKLRQWTLPLSYASCVALRAVFGAELRVEPALRDWAREVISSRVDRALAVKRSPDQDGDDRLYPFQRVGVAFLETAGSALLADEQGTGKTVQLSALLGSNPQMLPALIVCPNSVKRSWEDHLHTWAPHLTVQVVAGSAAVKKKQIASGADVTIIHWDALRLHSRLAPYGQVAVNDKERAPKELNHVGFETVIADEAHRAKDPTAKWTRALWALGEDAGHRFALTGTPVASRPDQLWSIMHFVDPDEYPVKSQWVDRYALTAWSPFGAPLVVGLRDDRRHELDRFLEPRMLRRTKKMVLPDLPPVVNQTVYVQMDAKQAKQYQEMEQDMRVALDDQSVTATTVLSQLTRLLQLASASIKEDDGVQLVKPSCKVDALLEILEDRDGSSTVVFAESRRLLELCSVELHKAKVDHVMLTGSVDERVRAANVARFQAGEVPVILVTLGAGGEGITLHRADAAIFLQRSWSMVKNLQAEHRIHRIGQEASVVHVIDVRTEGTVEERVLQKYGDNLDMLESLVRDRDALRDLLK